MITDYSEYKIDDIVADFSDRIYILESPHTTEIKLKNPACGETGLVMSKELFNISTPIGIAIQNKEIDKTGILNAVQFPLDERVYESVPKSLLEYMNIKKLKYSSNHFLNDIKKKISGIDELNTVANLRERIEKVTKENEIKEIIVCGFISQAYMELAFSEIKNIRFKTWTPLNVNGAIINIRYTHHPSPKRNGANWSI